MTNRDRVLSILADVAYWAASTSSKPASVVQWNTAKQVPYDIPRGTYPPQGKDLERFLVRCAASLRGVESVTVRQAYVILTTAEPALRGNLRLELRERANAEADPETGNIPLVGKLYVGPERPEWAERRKAETDYFLSELESLPDDEDDDADDEDNLEA